MTKLSETRDKDGNIIPAKLDQFIKEHRRDPKGDAEAFNRALESMAGKLSGARPASSEDAPDD